jgi:hypothetical protein
VDNYFGLQKIFLTLDKLYVFAPIYTGEHLMKKFKKVATFVAGVWNSYNFRGRLYILLATTDIVLIIPYSILFWGEYRYTLLTRYLGRALAIILVAWTLYSVGIFLHLLIFRPTSSPFDRTTKER